MDINFNADILPGLTDDLKMTQRACWYADGLFETIRMSNNAIPWLSYHWNRLKSGLRALEIDVPTTWNELFWETEIRKIASGNARVRLQVWRAAGGLYYPEQSAPVFLISAEPLEYSRFQWQEPGIRLGVATACRIPVDAFSGLKSLNTARYVAAALEARRHGWDDALVLNSFDRIAEACAGNVFWWEHEILCTTPLSEGCVDGVARRVLLEKAREFGLPVQEKSATFAALQFAEEVFLTNAIRGITPVAFINDRPLATVQTKHLFERFSGLQAG